MGIAEFFIMLFIILPLCFWLNYRTRSTVIPHPTFHKEVNSFHSVSIRPCSNACASVKKLKGIHFLASEVSPLPLYGCSSKKCSCTYQHYQDRRDGEDRRYLSTTLRTSLESNEQRLSDDDRRKQGFV
jgi:hypothetical protein